MLPGTLLYSLPRQHSNAFCSRLGERERERETPYEITNDLSLVLCVGCYWGARGLATDQLRHQMFIFKPESLL